MSSWGPGVTVAPHPLTVFSVMRILDLDLKVKLCPQVSKISLVDLAGSERADSSGAKGTRLKVRGHECHARVGVTKISLMSSLRGFLLRPLSQAACLVSINLRFTVR